MTTTMKQYRCLKCGRIMKTGRRYLKRCPMVDPADKGFKHQYQCAGSLVRIDSGAAGAKPKKRAKPAKRGTEQKLAAAQLKAALWLQKTASASRLHQLWQRKVVALTRRLDAERIAEAAGMPRARGGRLISLEE